MIEYEERPHAATGDTRRLGTWYTERPADVLNAIPVDLRLAERLRIERRAWQLLAAPSVRAWRVAICSVALLVGGLLTLAGALSDVSLLFGLAAAAHVVALVGWAVWFARWR